jgi:thiol-disulfide isomerase/thioredoxin
MKSYAYLILAFVLLFGCAARPAEAAENQAYEKAEAAEADVAEEMRELNTANLSFERDTSGVMDTNTTLPGRPEYDFSNVTTDEGKLIVYFFYSPYCVASKAIRPEIDRMESEYPDVLWMEYDISTPNGTYAYLDFAEQHNLSRQQRLVPQVLVNGTVITDRFNINKSLEGMLISFMQSDG